MTESADTELGTFVSVSLIGDADCYYVLEVHWDAIDAAFHQFVERRIDKLLTLTTIAGTEILVPVSRISDVGLSTPEARAKNRAIDAALRAEKGFSDD